MKGIYIPALHWEHGRSLVRARARIVSNQTRQKNRIWQLLHFSGLALPKDYEAGQYWSSRFIKELQATSCGSEELKITLGLHKDYQQTKTLLLEATRAIRKLCKKPEYETDIAYSFCSSHLTPLLFEERSLVFRFDIFLTSKHQFCLLVCYGKI